MENLCDQIKQMAVGVSHKERHQILAAIQDVYQDIESPENARTRIRSRVCCGILEQRETRPRSLTAMLLVLGLLRCRCK